MITAAGLAEALTPAFVELVEAGADRPVLAMEVAEAGAVPAVDRGDLVLGVGVRDEADVLGLVTAADGAAGLVLRRSWARLPGVREQCARLELPLLAVAEGATWISIMDLMRAALDTAAAGRHRVGSTDRVYGDLFDMADKVSAIIQAPITIEDATSRVVAYSMGQEDVDEARMSTIVGRRVPREVRDHFRSLGVFRRLARSGEPFLVPAGEDGVKARYIVPIRTGGEWLGSVWAVVDTPVPDERRHELNAAVEVIALYLLRLRSQSELHRQVQLDQLRTTLRGGVSARPDWLDDGPWRVAVLHGPADELTAEARRELWLALVRRSGWRQPLVADVDDSVYVLLRAETTGPGSWPWLSEIVRDEAQRNAAFGLMAGSIVRTAAELGESRSQADELDRLRPDRVEGPVASTETAWPALVLARAVSGLAPLPPVSPLTLLAERDHDGVLVATLEAVVDYWGEPQRAARALGVHPNTVRYRLARLAELCPVDLDDPAQRLAVRLEIARLRAGGEAAR